MKLLIVSDSHGAENYFYKAVEAEKEGLYGLIFLGDGADDFLAVRDYFPLLRFGAVRGNCDYFSSANFNYSDIFSVENKRIFYTHGHLYSAKQSIEPLISKAKTERADILLYGHTHSPHKEIIDGIFVMNPGSVKMGRYGVLTIENGNIKGELKILP